MRFWVEIIGWSFIVLAVLAYFAIQAWDRHNTEEFRQWWDREQHGHQ